MLTFLGPWLNTLHRSCNNCIAGLSKLYFYHHYYHFHCWSRTYIISLMLHICLLGRKVADMDINIDMAHFLSFVSSFCCKMVIVWCQMSIVIVTSTTTPMMMKTTLVVRKRKVTRPSPVTPSCVLCINRTATQNDRGGDDDRHSHTRRTWRGIKPLSKDLKGNSRCSCRNQAKVVGRN